MDIKSECGKIQQEAKAVRVKMADIYRAAGLNKTTWQRWHNGSCTPKLDAWFRFVEEAKKLIGAARRRETIKAKHRRQRDDNRRAAA